MAKKKKNTPAVKISPEKYVRERARRFPIVECKINRKWKETGECSIVIVRQRPDGNFIVGMYLVDMYCMGVKDAYVIPNATREDVEHIMKNTPDEDEMTDIPYAEAHNMIYGAIEFAEEAGITPHSDFKLAEYVLEEDTDDIPIIDFEYGHNGKHLLVIGPDGKERKYLGVLRKNLGSNFDIIDPLEDDVYDEDGDEDQYPGEDLSELPYTYIHPSFPEKLKIKNRFIAEALYSSENYYTLPDDVIDRIMGLPHEEAVSDLSAIALYELGRGYAEYEATGELTVGNDQSALLHTMVLLSKLGGKMAEDTVFEIMRMPFDMSDYYFSDIISEYGGAMLYSLTGGNLERIVEYLYEKGLSRDVQDVALYALAAAVKIDPARKEEVTGILRDILSDMKDKIPQNDTWIPESAGFAILTAADIKATELLPQIKELYDLDLVDPMVIGDYREAEEEFSVSNPGTDYSGYNYRPFGVKEFYKWNNEFFADPENQCMEEIFERNPIADVKFAD
ncbi:MAG: DUF1186 family protein [Muribaculaceae bacterium]|nr:DUF1186 family protein [Muribaculaceae bacterium]